MLQGPRCKKERRVGSKLFLKAERCQGPKCGVIRNPVKPGFQTTKRRRRTGLTEYGQMLLEKQKVQWSYFVKKGIVEFILADGTKGFKKEFPYDKILASASGTDLPQAWKDQLKIGGRIVCPIKNSIWLFVKKSKNKFEQTEYPGFVFVPLVNET